MPRADTVLVYVTRGTEVLLLHRMKEPNLGLWVAPGGHIEIGESPHDAAIRELYEETGLIADEITWRGHCTEVSPRADWQWALFLYVVRRFHGELKPDLREGDLAWVSFPAYFHRYPIPQADAIFAPAILQADSDRMFEAKFIYDANLRLVEWVRY